MATVRYRVVSDLKAFTNRLKEAREDVSDVKKEFLQESADHIALYSPVDTGTYMESHHIAQNREGTTIVTSSRGKERGRDFGEFYQEAITRLYSEIDSLPEDASNISVFNVADHADQVEYDHGYGVYTSLRSAAPTILERAIARKARSK